MSTLPTYAIPDVWIDERHGLRFHTHSGQTGPTGCLFVHRDKRNPDKWCLGGFDWASPTGPNWTLVSMQPFHVEPSIHCLTCGEHGYIREGEWIPA